MAPTTRSTFRFTTPPSETRQEATTVRRTRFFSTYDARKDYDSLRRIAKDERVPESTARNWIQQRQYLGSPAYRHTRKQSAARLGRPSKITKKQCQVLVSPSNPVRDQTYEVQLAYHDIQVHPSNLREALRRHTNKAQLYKQAYVQKKVSSKNKDRRAKYGETNQDKPVQGFWNCIAFTDEAHYDPASQRTGNILRERGTRYRSENIQQKPDLKGNKLHFAALVTYDFKSELIFYNDEQPHTAVPPKPSKPRKSKYETPEDFQERIRVWEASLPSIQEVTPKGNGMTQKYYAENLLPRYIQFVKDLEARFPNRTWILQEDGDPSHGIRTNKGKDSLCTTIRKENQINSLIHPAQSPDLNPIEGIWNILKQRVRRREWRTLEELKQILYDEWAKITIDEIRKRIDEMPIRCAELVKTGGEPIKSTLW